jgi:hypothetical protein
MANITQQILSRLAFMDEQKQKQLLSYIDELEGSKKDEFDHAAWMREADEIYQEDASWLRS